MKKNTSPAFSLAEILIALLVVCIILAAIAPIITKRTQKDLGSPLFKNMGRDGFVIGGPDGRTGSITIPKGVQTVYLTMTGGGGGGGAPERRRDIYYKVGEENILVNTDLQQCWTVPDGVSNVRVTLQGGGGGGGAGNSRNVSNADLAGIEEYFIPAVFNEGAPLCVKRQNIGDIYSLIPTVSPSGSSTNLCGYQNSGNSGSNNTTCSPNTMRNYSDISSFPIGQRGGIPVSAELKDFPSSSTAIATADYDKNECWYPGSRRSANSSGCTSNATPNNVAGGYGGCYRTLCGQQAAISACNALQGNWRLPRSAEVEKWGDHAQPQGINLCSESSSTSNLNQCQKRSNFNASSGPAWVWTGESKNTTTGYAYRINNNIGNLSTREEINKDLPMSVRCVSETTNCKFNNIARAGSGGGGGAYIEVTLPTVQPGDLICYRAGQGGTGGTYNSNDGRGGKGERSLVWIVRNGLSTNSIDAMGGEGGRGATTAENGNTAKGGVPSIPSSVSPNIASSGQDSVQVASDDYISISKGGDSGAVMAGKPRGGLGAGHPDNVQNGPNATIDTEAKIGYGAGGAGGYYITNKGGDGSHGFITIQYDITAPGGGGGSGAWLFNYRIDLEEKLANNMTIPNIRAGKAGQGGDMNAANRNGEDGESSVITINGITYTAGGGEGGKVGVITELGNVIKINDTTDRGDGGPGGTLSSNAAIDCQDTNPRCSGDGNAGSWGTQFAGGTGGGSFGFGTESAVAGLARAGGASGCKGPSVDTTTMCSGVPASLFDIVKRVGGGMGGNGIACWRDACETSTGGDGFVYLSW